MIDYDIIKKYINNFTKDEFFDFLYEVSLSSTQISYFPWSLYASNIITSSRKSIMFSGISFVVSLLLLILSSIDQNMEISSFSVILYSILFVVFGPLTCMESAYLLNNNVALYSGIHDVIKNSRYIFFYNTLAVFEEWESEPKDFHIPFVLKLVEWVFIFPIFAISCHKIALLIRFELRSIFAAKSNKLMHTDEERNIYPHDIKKWENMSNDYKEKYGACI